MPGGRSAQGALHSEKLYFHENIPRLVFRAMFNKGKM